jgi:hypothetical protein
VSDAQKLTRKPGTQARYISRELSAQFGLALCCAGHGSVGRVPYSKLPGSGQIRAEGDASCSGRAK